MKYDNHGTLIMDADHNLICDIRGWGRFQYMKDGGKIQDMMGEAIAKAINYTLGK